MRQVGTITEESTAQQFANYLYTLGMTAKAERDGEAWAVWVRDEEHVERASAELESFLTQPEDAKYAAAATAAKARRDELAKREDRARRNFVDMRRRWDARPTGPIPLTMGLILVCIIVAVLTNLGGEFGSRDDGPAAGLIDKLLLVPNAQREEYFARHRTSAPNTASAVINENKPADDRWAALQAVRSGEIWRLVTPIFIHFGVLHLLFNMSMFYSFGGLIESRRGSLRVGVLILLSAVLSNFGQFYFPSLAHPIYAYVQFGGMSGVVYALFGYIWMKSRYEPSADLYVHPNTVVLLMIWMVICMLGIIDGVANWAHGVGLAVGLAIGVAPYSARQVRRYVSRRMQ
jgi:GlpG protein